MKFKFKLLRSVHAENDAEGRLQRFRVGDEFWSSNDLRVHNAKRAARSTIADDPKFELIGAEAEEGDDIESLTADDPELAELLGVT